MSRSRLLLFVALTALTACGDQEKAPSEPWFAGAWFALHGEDGYLSERGKGQMTFLKDSGFNWVAYAPEPIMTRIDQPELRDDVSLADHRRVIRELQSRGLRVMLFPRIESPAFFRAENPLWRGDIRMDTKEEWELFHHRLGDLLESYAVLAEEEGIGLLCLGLEYRHSTSGHPEAWRTIIDRVRRRYSGRLTYSANWHNEYKEIAFWSHLDYIGIGAYFPIASRPQASRADMRSAWAETGRQLRGMAQKHDKKIIFTEIGYPCFDVAGWKPWEWTTRAGKTIDPDHQADCFRAFFDTIAREGWFAGYFIWRFHTDTRYIKEWEYSPQGREAEMVIRRSNRELKRLRR